MTRYAAETSVPTEKSKAEIEGTLTRYGATAFQYGWVAEKVAIVFEIDGRRYRFVLPLPAKDSSEVLFTAAGHIRSVAQRKRALEQIQRQRWRALALVVKAKLEAVESGISTLEQEMLAHIVLPDGETVGEWLAPQLEETYRQREMPPLLPEGRRAS